MEKKTWVICAENEGVPEKKARKKTTGISRKNRKE
jgi:hypothetical protein